MKKLILSLLLCLAVLTGCQPGEINETIYFDQIGDNITDAHKVQDLYVVNLWADSSNISGGGGGNVTGPIASTDNAIVRWDGVLGNALQDYTSNPPTISDTGDMDIDGDIASDSLITNYVDMSEAVEPASPAANNMRMFALDEHGYSVLSYKDAGGMVRQFMRDSVFIAYNDTGATIAAGRIVYASGSTGTVPEIALAKADSASTMPAIGVTVERLLHGAYGRVMQIGLLEDVNTSAYSAGDVLWVSETTAGIPTATQPTAPHISQEIGTILVDNAVTGAIQIVARSRIAFGVSENNTVQVDDTSVNATELAKWTAYGLEGYAQSGVTLPASPVTGDFFVHTPTGRSILYYYDGSIWQGICTLGTMTVYCDASDGTDNVTQGTGVDGDAFATLQYAIDTVPPLVIGDVFIYLSADDFNETVTIAGKYFQSSSYEIQIHGTLTANLTGTCAAGSVQGTGATQGTVVDDTGGFAANEYQNKLLYFNDGVNSGTYRITDNNTATTHTIVGTWPSGAPANGDNYTVYNWGTTVNSIRPSNHQANIYIYNIHMDTSYGFVASTFSRGQHTRCSINRIYINNGNWEFWECYIYQPSVSDITRLAFASFSRCKYYSYTNYCVRVFAGSAAAMSYGTVLDGGGNANTYGLFVIGSGYVGNYATASEGYVRIRDFTTGVYARTGGQVIDTVNVQYSGNGADETAVAASYGFID